MKKTKKRPIKGGRTLLTMRLHKGGGKSILMAKVPGYSQADMAAWGLEMVTLGASFLRMAMTNESPTECATKCGAPKK